MTELLDRVFDSAKHPHRPAGNEHGGEFAPTKGSGGGAPKKQTTWADDEIRFSVQPHIPAGQESWEASLTGEEREAILAYTHGSDDEINQALRGQTTPDAATTKQIAAIDTALAKAPGFDEPVTVWRGASFEGYRQDEIPAYIASHYTPGQTIVMDGYQSSSFWVEPPLDASLSKTNNGIVFEIKTRKGAYIGDISYYDDEAEVLLPHKASYRVVDALPNVTFLKDDREVTRHVVQLELLP